MGFKYEGKRFNLKFEGDFEGLEVKTRSVPLGQYLEVQELLDSDMDREQIDKLFGEFSKVIVSWNLEDDNGDPVPTTAAGLYTQELELVQAITSAWRDAMVGVPAPLEPSSSDGEPSLVASIPMDVSPESQAS
jgi:hypothetical protein